MGYQLAGPRAEVHTDLFSPKVLNCLFDNLVGILESCFGSDADEHTEGGESGIRVNIAENDGFERLEAQLLIDKWVK